RSDPKPAAGTADAMCQNRLSQRLSLGYHRQNRAKEIRSRFHQLVRASRFKLISVTVPPKHTKTAHSNRVSADDVISAVPDHETTRGGYILFGQDVGEQLWLTVQLTAWHRAVDAIEVCC